MVISWPVAERASSRSWAAASARSAAAFPSRRSRSAARGSVVTRSPLPSLVTSITLPVSAISALAPMMPGVGARGRPAAARRAPGSTCSPMSSRRRPVGPSRSRTARATCWRLLWMAGMTMWLGVSCASWMIHSPRSVSTTCRPAASRWWLRKISSATMLLPLASSLTFRSRRSSRMVSRASSAVLDLVDHAPGGARGLRRTRVGRAGGSRKTWFLASTSRSRAAPKLGVAAPSAGARAPAFEGGVARRAPGALEGQQVARQPRVGQRFAVALGGTARSGRAPAVMRDRRRR